MATPSLVHLVQQPRVAPPAGEKPPVLLLLHGVGSNERDLLGLASYLDGRFLVISVRSRLPLGPDSYGWYPVQFTERGVVADEGPAEESRQILADFLPWAILEYGGNPERVYLLGFSQGAVMSFFLALTRPELVAGAVLMSGRPMGQEQRAEDAALSHLQFLAVHGLYDPVLPVSEGRAIRDTLQQLPVGLTYQEFPMGHEVRQESLSLVAGWLQERLGGV